MAERAPIFDYSMARDGVSSPAPENQSPVAEQVVEESSKPEEKPARSKAKARPSVKRGRKLRVARPASRAADPADEVPGGQDQPSEQHFEDAPRSISESPLEPSFGQPDSQVADDASSDDGQAAAGDDRDAASEAEAGRSGMRTPSRRRKPAVRRLGAKRSSGKDASERMSAERAARKEAILRRFDEAMLDGGFEPVERVAEPEVVPQPHDRQDPVAPDADDARARRGKGDAKASQLVSSKVRAMKDKASSLAKGGADGSSKSAGDLATSITEGILKLATVVVEFAKKPHSKRFNRGVAIALALVVAITFIYPSAKDYYVAIRDNAKSEAEYAALQEYYEQLKEDVEVLGTDQGIEDAARDEFGMIMPGDVAMNIKDLDSEADFDKNPTEIGITPAGSIKAPEKWYTYILDPFFGYEG